jgi:uncharacterized protein (TIGR02680 family)
LHRGGIINIWQYAEHTFELDGGRAVFQGTNGSGKSRTLELLLPLCLDGDLRQLGSKGFDTVSIRRLMLDEYPGGPNRVGYAWVELARDIPGGGTEHFTCGIGVKASKTSQSISDSWRFATSQRVGSDLRLVGPDRVPLGPAQLRDALGADCVLDEQSFRAKVAATVYGMPAARYGDLLHLQRTLRNPDVGLKVLEGQLEQILSDALPPLDSALVERLATSFDDLESIRENIVRLTAADRALGQFLTTYSDYALGALREKAESARSAADRLRGLRDELAGLDERLEAKQHEREAAEREIADLEKRESELETSAEALRSHPAYTELQNLHDRQRLVDSARSAAVTALETAGRHRAQEDRSAESALAAMRRLAGEGDDAERTRQRAAEQMSAAGLDGSLLPQLPEVPAPESAVERSRVRTSPEPGAEPEAVERRTAPLPDLDACDEQFREAAGRISQVRAAAKQRGAQALSLHEQAVKLDSERDRVGELQRQARQAQVQATEKSGLRNQAQQELTQAAADWVEQAGSWLHAWTDAADAPKLPTAEQVRGDRSAARSAREQARRWARPRLHEARRQVADVERHLDELRSRARERDAELSELRAGTAEEGDRNAFHRLVDFRESLDDVQRAGLEAALEASGLLSASVSADGEIPGGDGVFAAPAGDCAGPALADLLVAAPEPDCPVPRERIEALLRSVPADLGAPGLALSSDGSWRAGVLTGRRSKDTAERVGAGAREAARTRRIAEVEDELSQLRSEIGEAERAHRDAGEHLSGLERHLEAFPDDSDVLTAHARLATALDTAQEAEDRAARLRSEHGEAEQRWQASRSELVRNAAEADLAADTRTLEAAHRAASQAVTALDDLRAAVESRCAAALADLRETAAHHDAAVADRVEAEERAEDSCTSYAEQASGLAELTEAVGGEAQEVSAKVSELEQERAEVREQLPEARERLSSLREATARLQAQRESKRSGLAARESEERAAAEAFRTALGVAGLWSATGLSDEDGAPSPDRAAELLAASDRKGAGETAVLNRLQALQQSLSGNYDISAGEEHGLLTITVTGEEGAQPVAEAARRVGERLGVQQGFLNERYQSIFADYLVRDLAERLRGQIAVADDLCARMNRVLDGARSSQGVHVRLEWQPSAALGEDLRQAIELVRMPLAERSEEQDALLRRVFTELIESERDSASGGYAEILARALDYRSWFAFTVRVRDTGPEGKPRVRRLRQLSSGETRLISYVTLFAAAAAFYDAISAEGSRPLRLVLLDEAFERLDDPTVARMLGLLVDLDMDWVITWPSGWGVSPKIPKMHIYDVLRPRSGHGIACTHTTWNGTGLERFDG